VARPGGGARRCPGARACPGEHGWGAWSGRTEEREREERFASVERGDAVLRHGARRRKNAYLVCAVCWSLFFNAKALCIAHFCICMSLLESV